MPIQEAQEQGRDQAVIWKHLRSPHINHCNSSARQGTDSVVGETGLLADANRFFMQKWVHHMVNDRLTPDAICGARSTWQIGGFWQG